MGIYLPNVDMPKGDKVVTIQICPDGSIWQQYRGTVPNAKAVPVPPHGRLGDLDALVKRLESEKAAAKQIDNYDYWYALSVAVDFALAAPTVIQASGGKEDE